MQIWFTNTATSRIRDLSSQQGMDSPNLETAARFVDASATATLAVRHECSTSQHQCAEVHHQLQLSVMGYHRARLLGRASVDRGANGHARDICCLRIKPGRHSHDIQYAICLRLIRIPRVFSIQLCTKHNHPGFSMYTHPPTASRDVSPPSGEPLQFPPLFDRRFGAAFCPCLNGNGKWYLEGQVAEVSFRRARLMRLVEKDQRHRKEPITLTRRPRPQRTGSTTQRTSQSLRN